jgi:four helix bundle protein
MGMSRNPRKLKVFDRAHGLAIRVYRLTATFPNAERYGLCSQLRRAAVSVPTNIVEGCARQSAREYDRFLDVALGSAAEVGYLLELASDLGVASREKSSECRECADHVIRELQNLRRAVRTWSANPAECR